MNSLSRSPFSTATETSAAATSPAINAYRWLLVLGFPAPIAAASTMPELFTTEDAPRAKR